MMPYALLVPMLYCDAIIDAMNKGLGQQKVCVRYNILTALMDVAGLYILLPVLGMKGYFISFFVSHAVNAALSLGLLLKTARIRVRPQVPMLALLCVAAALVSAFGAGHWAARMLIFGAVLIFALFALGILHREDLQWLWRLIKNEKKTENLKNNV